MSPGGDIKKKGGDIKKKPMPPTHIHFNQYSGYSGRLPIGVYMCKLDKYVFAADIYPLSHHHLLTITPSPLPHEPQYTATPFPTRFHCSTRHFFIWL